MDKGIRNDTGRAERMTGAEHTREALIRAGLRLFGEKGFEGASTRALAAAAGANIGSIAYHFGGKEGLHEACALYIVETISSVAGEAIGSAESFEGMAPEDARAMLVGTLDAMMNFVVARLESGEIVQFVLRELTHRTEALDIIYKGVFEPVHKRLCALWETATGEAAESETTKITVFTLIGQVVYFRIAREPVMRRMGWDAIGPREALSLASITKNNLEVVLSSRRQKNR